MLRASSSIAATIYPSIFYETRCRRVASASKAFSESSVTADRYTPALLRASLGPAPLKSPCLFFPSNPYGVYDTALGVSEDARGCLLQHLIRTSLQPNEVH